MATVSPRPETVVCNLLKGLDDPPEGENIVVRADSGTACRFFGLTGLSLPLLYLQHLSHRSPPERRVARLSDYPVPVLVNGTQPLCGHFDVGETCVHVRCLKVLEKSLRMPPHPTLNTHEQRGPLYQFAQLPFYSQPIAPGSY